jgi:dephospho-CoA kinase
MKHIIALVGMPGAGKSEAAAYLKSKQIPFIRFGDLTEETLKEKGLTINPENERAIREQLRKELGMHAYAIKAKPKIEELLLNHPIIGLDGLYSWEEYKYLKQYFPQLILIHIAAGARTRYTRLTKRAVRPLTEEQARQRDITELENLNKGGPIAIADYIIENNNEDINKLHEKLETIINKVKVE